MNHYSNNWENRNEPPRIDGRIVGGRWPIDCRRHDPLDPTPMRPPATASRRLQDHEHGREAQTGLTDHLMPTIEVMGLPAVPWRRCLPCRSMTASEDYQQRPAYRIDGSLKLLVTNLHAARRKWKHNTDMPKRGNRCDHQYRG